MKITNVAIKYRTTMVVLTFLLVVGGLLSYTTIPKESFPSIEIPNIIVTTIYPGASPDDVESLLTEPIEQEIQGINGIKEIRSTSVEGVSSIVVEFNPDVSMDDAFQKVRDKVDVAKAELPDDVEEPLVSEIDLQEFPVMTVNLAAPYSLARLKEVAEDLSDELETIPSVLEVPVTGGLEREVQVNVNLNALQGYNLTFDDLITTIRQENTNLPGGSVDVDRLNYLIRIDGEFENPEEEIENLVIESKDGTPVYVRDVADVVFGYKERASYARLRVLKFEDEEDNLTVLPADEIETLQVVNLGIKKRSGANILETASAVQATLDAFPLPAGTQVVITGDQSEQVQVMVKDLENNIIAGIIFVIAVLLFFLGVRNATLVGIAIPLSMFITFMIFQAMGQTLNFIILFSLIIALGMLVDNAVVIVENIYRFREQGHSRFEAARLGTAEVAGPVVASTATTIAAFGPMLFWPGLMGEFMSYLPLTLIVTLASSLFVAILINPGITGIFIRLEDEEHPERPRTVKIIGAVTILVFGLVLAFANYKMLVVLLITVPLLILLHKHVMNPIGQKFVQKGLPRLLDKYRAFLHWMLERDYTARRAMLRNTFALGSFTGGFVLLILSSIVGGLAGQTASMILLVPGGLLLVVGILGLIFHSLESLYLGGRGSVKAGLIFGGVSFVIAGLMYLSPREVELVSIINLMILPAIIVVVGLIGMAFNRRERLVLTDNRARLMTGVLGSLFAILAMFVVANPGTELFPDTDPNLINITLEAPLGTNVETSNRIAEQAEAAIVNLLNQDEVDRANLKNISIGVGVSADADFGGGASSAERSRLTLNMVDYADRPASSKFTMTHLREQLQGIPGVEIEFAKDNAGPPTGAPVNIEVSGEDFSEISRITQEIKQRLVQASETGTIPGLVDVADNLNTGRPEMRVNVDRERAGRFGLNTFDVANTVRAAINGIEASKYRTGEDEYDIIVRLSEDERASLESIKNLTIMNEDQQIPLTAVANLEIGGGLGSVTRLDLKRVSTVTGDAAPGYNAQAVLAQVQAHLADYEQNLPAGYNLAYTGENEEQDNAFGFLTTALLIGVALIFMIMIAQFNSVSGPFIIMVAVGFSLIGVLLGLLLTRTPFGLMTFIGVISLAGIVVNNNIVLIDYIMQLRDRGLEKQQAIIEGGATRLRPVTLTALTTVIGLVPLTFGINIDFVGLLSDWDPNFAIGSENTQFWGPMGTAIISGLTFATFLTLVIVPVMYSIFDSLGLRLGALFSGREAEEEALVPAGNGYGAPAGAMTKTPQGHATSGNGSSYKPEVEEDPKV
ncbi:MAG TPA: efflux RND transporter permease subunit [Rhodothermales bacterium]|nr:efflux RND transporter permease subunit [Rhodothermales bacterium]